MSGKIARREHTLQKRRRRLAAKHQNRLERCPHDGCTALNGPNALYCHKCGGRLYGLGSS